MLWISHRIFPRLFICAQASLLFDALDEPVRRGTARHKCITVKNPHPYKWILIGSRGGIATATHQKKIGGRGGLKSVAHQKKTGWCGGIATATHLTKIGARSGLSIYRPSGKNRVVWRDATPACQITMQGDCNGHLSDKIGSHARDCNGHPSDKKIGWCGGVAPVAPQTTSAVAVRTLDSVDNLVSEVVRDQQPDISCQDPADAGQSPLTRRLR